MISRIMVTHRFRDHRNSQLYCKTSEGSLITTLARFVAVFSARVEARCLGIIDQTEKAEERRALATELRPRRQNARLLSRDPAGLNVTHDDFPYMRD